MVIQYRRKEPIRAVCSYCLRSHCVSSHCVFTLYEFSLSRAPGTRHPVDLVVWPVRLFAYGSMWSMWLIGLFGLFGLLVHRTLGPGHRAPGERYDIDREICIIKVYRTVRHEKNHSAVPATSPSPALQRPSYHSPTHKKRKTEGGEKRQTYIHIFFTLILKKDIASVIKIFNLKPSTYLLRRI